MYTSGKVDVYIKGLMYTSTLGTARARARARAAAVYFLFFLYLLFP